MLKYLIGSEKMTEEKIWMNQNFEYNDGSCLEYSFQGKKSDSTIEIEKLKILIANMFQNRNRAPNIIEATTKIKRALKTLKESKLEISVYKNEDFLETVTYRNSKLNTYYYHKEPNEKEIAEIIFKQDKKQGFNFTINKTKKRKNKEVPTEQIIEIFNRKTKTLRQLEDLKLIPLSFDEKLISIVYRLFYHENPDFSRSEDKIKAQSMLAFLVDFSITLPEDYCFILNSSNMVVSLPLARMLNDLGPLGEIKEEFEDIKLCSEAEQTIKIVGQEIRKYMKNQENPVEWFKNLVRINYIKNNRLPSNSSTQTIASESQCSEETVKTNLTLVKKISNQVYQN